MRRANILRLLLLQARLWAFGLLLTGFPASALTLELPGRVIGEKERSAVPGSYALPLAPFDGSGVPSREVEGALDQRAFELETPELTTLAVLAPLRDQVVAAGFDLLLDCESRACGGFDFRFATDVLPEPWMHVDIGDFRFLSAERDGEVVSILVSRGAASTFVQVTRVTPLARLGPEVTAPIDFSTKPVAEPANLDMATALIGPALDDRGSAVLDDLVFASGSAALSDGEYPSLDALAAWLAANPDATIVLVGHTDAAGSLAANIALSKRRAEAVTEVLEAVHGVERRRVAAEGVGFLAPRATNETEDGRQLNRRVEVVVTQGR